MKAHIPAFIIIVALLPSLLISSEMESLDHLIFPNPGEKICFVMATGKSEGLLVGEKLPADHVLVKEIVKQMNFPFHQSIIKLSQCARNMASKSEGPNVLFLSKTEGGFPRTGTRHDAEHHGGRDPGQPFDQAACEHGDYRLQHGLF